MKKLLFFISLILIVACEDEKQPPSKLFNFIPPNTAAILKSDNLSDFSAELEKNEFLKTNAKNESIKELKAFFKSFQFITVEEESLLCFNQVGRKNIALTLITEEEPKLKLDSVQNKMVETFKYDNKEIKKYTLEGQETFASKLNNIHVFSTSKLVLENIIRIFEEQLPQDPTLEKIYDAASGDHSLFIQHEEFAKIYGQLLPNAAFKKLGQFTDWTVIDLSVDEQSFGFNGVSSTGIKENKLLSIFQGIKEQENQLQQIVPLNANGYFSFTYQNFEDFKNNLTEYRAQELAPLKNEAFFNSINEVAEIYFENSNAIAVNANDASLTAESLSAYQVVEEDFRGVSIFKFEEADNFFEAYQPLIKQKNIQFYAQLDSFFIFSEDLKTLENMIANFQNRTVLGNSPAFKNLKGRLSDDASILLVSLNKNLIKKIGDQVEEDQKQPMLDLQFKKFDFSIVQLTYDDSFAYVNGLFPKSEARENQQNVAQLNSIKLPENMVMAPQFVKNWGTKQMEVAVQTENNTLYLYKNNGELHWKKQLDSRILNPIEQIDIYNNGRLQLVFNTQNKLYILDRNGNEVKPFPLSFNGTLTQPVAVFDYDNNSKYRFLIAEGNEVKMYNKEGKRVNGFKFSKTESPVMNTPQHIRFGRKDYILIPEENGKLHILNRTGETRVKTKEELAFSQAGWHHYQNKFTTTTTTGELLQIDEQAKISKKDLGLGNMHYMTAYRDVLVTLDENKLNINGKKIELDYGLYEKPQLMEANGKTYIAVTDTQASKVYVFDETANLLSGFPVYGNSAVDIANMDNRGKLELVVKGEDNSVLIYQMN